MDQASERTTPAGHDGALRHFGKVFLVFAGAGVAYTLALAGAYMAAAGPESALSAFVPRAVSLKACLAEGWLTVLYQPLFWLTAGVVLSIYNAVTGEIDPGQ